MQNFKCTYVKHEVFSVNKFETRDLLIEVKVFVSFVIKHAQSFKIVDYMTALLIIVQDFLDDERKILL